MTLYTIPQTIKCPDCGSRNLWSSIRKTQPLALELVYDDRTQDFFITGIDDGTAEDYDDRMYHECQDCLLELSTSDFLPANLPTP